MTRTQKKKKWTSTKIVLNDKFVQVMLKCRASIVARESQIAGVISLVQHGTMTLEICSVPTQTLLHMLA